MARSLKFGNIRISRGAFGRPWKDTKCAFQSCDQAPIKTCGFCHFGYCNNHREPAKHQCPKIKKENKE